MGNTKFKIGDRVKVRADYVRNPRHAGREFIISSDEGTMDGEQTWGGDDIPYRFTEDELEPGIGSPIRLVTRKEIVSGTYGQVSVFKPWVDGKASVAVTLVKAGEQSHVDTPHYIMEAKALRAAATTFTELADALESEPTP